MSKQLHCSTYNVELVIRIDGKLRTIRGQGLTKALAVRECSRAFKLAGPRAQVVETMRITPHTSVAEAEE
jgi:hypothetical protein